MALHLFERAKSIGIVSVFVLIALYAGFVLFLEVVTFRRSVGELDTLDKISERIMGKTWLLLKGLIYKRELDTELPSLVASASGVVVELGPGSGNQLGRYDKEKVKKIYGIEPNTDLHPELQANIVAHGLADIYTIVPCGIQDSARLASFGLKEGGADTVMSVQVLCSVPEPREMVKRLYRLLKPGGTMIVYEHVRAVDWFSRTVQDVYNTFWPYLFGNCHLDRPTGDFVLAAGQWEKVDVRLPEQDDPWLVIPHVSGKLVRGKI